MDKLNFLAIFWATFSIGDCFILFRNQYELIYDYNSRISSGVIGRCDNSSDLVFNATISIKTYPNLTYVTLKNFAYDYVLGEDSLLPNGNASKLPEDVLGMPFIIRYDENALITDILTETKDELWSINIKKGIASLFQMDMEHETTQEGLQHGFYSDENTVAGRCRVSYTTKPGGEDGVVLVVKQIDMSSCQGHSWTKPFKTYEQPVSVLSTRTYEISGFFDSIINENIITTSPITGGTYIQMINTTQILTLVSSDKINEASLPSIDTMISRTLEVSFMTDEKNKYDLTSGRMTFDPAAIVNDLKTSLEVLSGDIKIFGNIGSSISKKEDSVRTIIKKMELLDESQLGTVLELLKGNKDAIKTFFKTVQSVGTRSSMIFIKNYLLKNPIEKLWNYYLLGSIAENWKYPDFDILKELSVLIKPEIKFNDNIKRNIILSYSILINKFISTHNEDLVKHLIQLYIDGLKSSKTEYEQIIYILGMKNIHSLATRLYLESVINGEVGDFTPYVRSLAVWALQGSYKTAPKVLDRIFLSLISNTSEECNVRCTALHVYLAQPTVTKLMQLTTFIEVEQHGDVYSAYYTKLSSLALLRSPRYKQVSDYARAILKQLSPVPYAVNIQKIFDNYDAERNVVNTMTFSMSGNLYKDGHFAMYFDLPDVLEDQDSVFIRFMLKDLKLEQFKRSLAGKDYFKNVMSDIMNSRNVKFDIMFLNNGIVQAPITENLSMADIQAMKVFSSLISSYALRDSEVVIPTDIGLPVVYFTNKLSRGMSTQYFRTKPHMHFMMDYATKVAMEYGVKFYNPVANIWQGVKRNNVMHTDIPFNMTFEVLKVVGSTPKMTFNLNHTRDGIIKTIGLETLAYTDVYVEDYTGAWKKSCPSCHKNLFLTHGNQNQYTIWKNSCDMLGVDFELGVYDCETNVSQEKISKTRSSLLKGINQNTIRMSFDPKMLSFMGPYKNAFLLPHSDHCGVRLTAKPDHFNSMLKFTARSSNSPEKFFSMNYTINDEGTRGWSVSMNPTILEVDPTMTSSVVISYKQLGNESTSIEHHYSLSDFNLTNNIKVSTLNSQDPTNMTISISAGLKHIISQDVEKIYEECLAKGLDWQCTAQATYLDSYEYEINFDKISKDHQKLWRRMFYLFQTIYGDYFIYSEDIQKWHKNTIKIIVSLQSHSTADVTVLTEFDSFHYKGIPMDSLVFSLLFQPVSTHQPIGWAGLLQSATDQFYDCDATKDYVKMTSGLKNKEQVNEEWTDLMSIRNVEDRECSYCVYYRWQNQTKLGLRVVTPEGTLEAYKPNEDKNMHVIWKEKPITLDFNCYFVDDFIKIKMLDTSRMLLLFRQEYFNIDFTESQIRAQFQKSKNVHKRWSGKCLPVKDV